MPALPVCGAKAFELSTSVALSVPPVVRAALVSVSEALLVPLMTAASLTAATVMVSVPVSVMLPSVTV